MRIVRLHQFDDLVGDLAVMRADDDDLGVVDAGRDKHVLAGTIAEIDAEAEARGLADTVGGLVDNGHGAAAGKQNLGDDLAEAREADHQNIGLGAFEILFELLFRLGHDEEPGRRDE